MYKNWFDARDLGDVVELTEFCGHKESDIEPKVGRDITPLKNESEIHSTCTISPISSANKSLCFRYWRESCLLGHSKIWVVINTFNIYIEIKINKFIWQIIHGTSHLHAVLTEQGSHSTKFYLTVIWSLMDKLKGHENWTRTSQRCKNVARGVVYTFSLELLNVIDISDILFHFSMVSLCSFENQLLVLGQRVKLSVHTDIAHQMLSPELSEKYN